MSAKKEVLVIFKTHLDIGFTDYSKTVVDKYLTEYIPNAIKVGNELKNTDTPFVWSLGSWMVYQALKNDKDNLVANAIKDGVLRWHALPFTSHTELMSKKLFDYGVSLSKQLDERFGTTTIGAKMTDVPGHTLGMIPIMNKYGVKFLHIGVNTATPVPNLPNVFRWKYNDSEIVVMYQGDYGQAEEFDDFIVYFAHTSDNKGPQTAKDVIDEYQKIKTLYPDCVIKAGTIDDLAERVCKIKNLPIIDKEIGDTWIHGAGTDPQKVSRYKKLLRNFDSLDKVNVDITDNLLLIPEHTWGMDFKSNFSHDVGYTHLDIESHKKERVKIEKSWQEQRDYVTLAEELLSVTPDYPINKPDLSKYQKIDIPKENPYCISWQIFDKFDYANYKDVYLRNLHVDAWWKLWDFTKQDLPDYKGDIYTANIVEAYQRDGETLYKLSFDDNVKDTYGLPYFYLSIQGDNIKITWFNKRPSRLPQACWFKINGLKEDWQVNKMDVWISPDDIIDSPLILAVDKGVKNDDVLVECLDNALVAPFGRRLLQYNVKQKSQDMYFNLYNNVWNTNFPMWYSDDAMFRFKINKLK